MLPCTNGCGIKFGQWWADSAATEVSTEDTRYTDGLESRAIGKAKMKLIDVVSEAGDAGLQD